MAQHGRLLSLIFQEYKYFTNPSTADRKKSTGRPARISTTIKRTISTRAAGTSRHHREPITAPLKARYIMTIWFRGVHRGSKLGAEDSQASRAAMTKHAAVTLCPADGTNRASVVRNDSFFCKPRDSNARYFMMLMVLIKHLKRC